MAEESLDILRSSNVPHGNSLVSTATSEYLRVRHKLDGVHRVDVTTEREPALRHVHVPKFDCVVHRAGQKEVSCVVVGNLPHWLAMLSESLRTTGVDKVPDFDSSIA
jgi:hypothetical protein